MLTGRSAARGYGPVLPPPSPPPRSDGSEQARTQSPGRRLSAARPRAQGQGLEAKTGTRPHSYLRRIRIE
eukprot:3691182-Prymnesium_polylepis.1